MIDLPLIVAAWGLALALLPWFALMALVVIAAVWQRASGATVAPDPGAARSRFLVVIPAHDEAGVVGITVRSCLAVDYDPERFQVFVIADNCTDETAAEASEAGAGVLVRHDPSRKSKGFALEDFFKQVPTNPSIRPCDAYILVDADTSVAPDLLLAFDRSLRRGDDFVQGYYTVRNADASWRTRLLTHAFSLANGVWLAGLDRLGLSVGLKGNGMCFRAAALDRFPWRAHGLVEDMEFAWNLRIGGERVRFQPDARVHGEMVSRGGAGAASQRQRWEAGRKALRSAFRRSLRATPRLSAVKKLAYLVDLEFPPLSRLGVGLVVASMLAAIEVYRSKFSLPNLGIAALLGFDWAFFLAYIISPIFVVELPVRYLLSLMHLPYYMAWKLSVGLLKKPGQWIRTPREAPATTSAPVD